MQMGSHNYQEVPPSKERVRTTQKLGEKTQTSPFRAPRFGTAASEVPAPLLK